MSRRTIFVGGMNFDTTSDTLAEYFKKYGKLRRCDVPTPGGQSKGFAFIEFEDERDAEDAFDALQGKRIDGRSITLQWARKPPLAGWRYSGEGSGGGDRDRRSRSRSRSPARRRSRSRSRSRDRSDKKRRSSRSRSRSPKRSSRRSRSRSPADRGRDRSRERDRERDGERDRKDSRERDRKDSPPKKDEGAKSP